MAHGFSHPVFDAQSTFRALLRAMSRPARPVRLPVLPQGPAGWPPSITALVLTLCDMDTPLWLDAAAASEEACQFLRFHCASPLTGDPRHAAFAVILGPANLPPLDSFAQGSVEYPETSTTLIMACGALPHTPQGGSPLDPNQGVQNVSAQVAANTSLNPMQGVQGTSPLAAGGLFPCTGPGLEQPGYLPLSWLPAGFATAWQANRQIFPCGVDMILAGPDAIVGLPRTLALEAPCM